MDEQQQTPPQVMSVGDIRAALVHLMQLPSGPWVKLKRASLVDLVERGDIPDTLSAQVSELMKTTDAANADMSLDDLKQYAEAVNLVCMACFVEPPLAPEGTETALGVKEIPFVDRVMVFQWANEATETLRPFRPQPANAVPAASNR